MASSFTAENSPAAATPDRDAAQRRLFLTIAGAIACSIGGIATAAPAFLLETMKHASAPPVAMVMTRTTGVCLLSAGALLLLVRRSPPSSSLRAILLANFGLQLAIIPIDPHAYFEGTFQTLSSFVPNTVLHVALAFGFFFFWMRASSSQRLGAPVTTGAHDSH